MAETAKAYPTGGQYDRWKARADELDMSVSEFIQNMVEAGMKVDRGFDVELHPDESADELRDERNYWKGETERLRERIAELEDRVYDSERAAVEDHINDSSMASFDQILSHVRESAPGRVTQHLDAMTGDSIARNPNGLYVPLEGSE